MNQEEINDFVLVGGTALSLQIGHRVSIDIDLFGNCVLDEIIIGEILSNYGETQNLKKSKRIQIFSVLGIKVDFVDYQYKLLSEPVIAEGIRIASLKDIAAMKLNAICGRGSKKDFIDLYFLLKFFSLDEIVGFYLEKYHDGSEFLVRKSLTYFEDADKDEMPLMLTEVSWKEIKDTILKIL
jgi:predicted nucleotidyltransferase component of viral defense system